MSKLTERIEIKSGSTYLVEFAGRMEKARVLSVQRQLGADVVTFRMGIPLVGVKVVESSQRFWERMVKA